MLSGMTNLNLTHDYEISFEINHQEFCTKAGN